MFAASHLLIHWVNEHGEDTTDKLPPMPLLLCHLGAFKTPWVPGNGLQIKGNSLGRGTPVHGQTLPALQKKATRNAQTNLISPSPCLS
jgi:hypothetical protein